MPSTGTAPAGLIEIPATGMRPHGNPRVQWHLNDQQEFLRWERGFHDPWVNGVSRIYGNSKV